jgi:hypothetical protein
MVKFKKFYVTDGTVKAKISYSLDNHRDKKCVTLYEKDYERNLGIIFPEIYANDTDYMTDYFDKGRVIIFEDHPLYNEVRPLAEQYIIEDQAKWMTKKSKYATK